MKDSEMWRILKTPLTTDQENAILGEIGDGYPFDAAVAKVLLKPGDQWRNRPAQDKLFRIGERVLKKAAHDGRVKRR